MSMTAAREDATRHEQRLSRRLEARGEPGLGEALIGLKGTIVGGRHRIEYLYAVGGESAVYVTRDLKAPNEPLKIAKVALLPLHRPIDLRSGKVRRQRNDLRIEGLYLSGSGSRFLPKFEGLIDFENPLLDPERGGAFKEPEPLILMEMLPGCDLDRWLARMHRSDIPRPRMRRSLDRVAVTLLQALVDLYDRDFIYADLRPGNLRVMGRPERLVRLLDAGSLVRRDDQSGRFPHVPSYLPPRVFKDRMEGIRIIPSGECQAVMAGRTLFEVATGCIPLAGRDVDTSQLEESNVSPPIAEVVEGLCKGDFAHVRHAYRFLVKRASRRIHGGNDPQKASQEISEEDRAKQQSAAEVPLKLAPAPPPPARPAVRRPAPPKAPAAPVPPARPTRPGWLARLLAFLRIRR